MKAEQLLEALTLSNQPGQSPSKLLVIEGLP